MSEALRKYYSFLKATARRFSLALAGTLALALAIGANGAIFSLEGLNSSAEIYPDPIKLLFQSNLQSQPAEPSRSEESARERGKVLEPDAAVISNALLPAGHYIALSSYPWSARIILAIAGKASN